MAEDGVVVVALGKKLVWIHLQHLQRLGMDRWKLVVFAFFFLAVSLFVSIHGVHLSKVFHN